MAPYFPQDTIDELNAGFEEIHSKFAELRETYVTRNYLSEKAREYATQGFGRRLSTLIHCTEMVFGSLPPALDEIPERDDVDEAAIAIQAFVINCQGCVDNLAWVWVAEKNVRESDGTEINPKRVGLSQRNRSVRKTFSDEFRAYLDSREDWFEHLKEFRDSLAHRIPLYIPPYVVTPEKLEKYNQLGAAAVTALAQGDIDGYDANTKAQNALGVWRPWMTHSRTENAPTAIFHAQLVADYLTIDELGREMLKELDR